MAVSRRERANVQRPLQDWLGKVGLGSVLMARNSARAAFAADIPPALLADELGLSISAAVAWSKAVSQWDRQRSLLRSGGVSLREEVDSGVSYCGK
jgi:hypothetical protein